MGQNRADNILIHLRDAETEKIYGIYVTSEEAELLETDLTFATKKLHEAMQMHETNKCDDSNSSVGDCNECTNNEMFNETEEDKTFKWSREAILLLIEEYRMRQADFTNGKMSHKKIWALIANEMIKHSHSVTGPQCLSKFSGLKRTYKTIKDHNSKSGNSTRTWPYFSLINDLLGSKPFMSPLTTISSTGKRVRPSSDEGNTSTSSSIEETSQSKKAKHTIVERLLETLKNDKKIAEEAAEKRHQENMELRQRLLNSFERMVDILDKH